MLCCVSVSACMCVCLSVHVCIYPSVHVCVYANNNLPCTPDILPGLSEQLLSYDPRAHKFYVLEPSYWVSII